MTCGTLVLIILTIALIIYTWQRRRKKIDAIWLEDSDTNVLERWKYSPEEWKKFAEDDFSWVKNKDLPGEFSISDDSILISNGRDEFFRDINGEWTLTNIEFRESTSIFRIKLRQSRENRSIDMYEYFYEDLWIPIPPGNTEKARRIVEHFYENMRIMKENLKGAGTNDLLFGQFLNSEISEDENSENT
jgi:hypothetical protein